MSLANGFDPLDDGLRERYLECFTPMYWDEDVVSRSPDGYISRAKSNMGRKGRRHAQELFKRHGSTLVPQSPRAIREGALVPDDIQLSPGRVVKVIAETAYGTPEPDVIEYLADVATGEQRISANAFDIRLQGPNGQQYLYHQEAEWFIAETNAGSPAGVSLFPLDIDYESSAFVGPYGDEGGTSFKVANVRDSAGIPLVQLGLQPTSTPQVHHRIARAVIYDDLLPNHNRLFVPDVTNFM